MEDCIIYPSIYKNSPSLASYKQLFSVAPITVNTISDRRICNSHWHDYLQLWYTVSGSYLHTANGVAYPQNPGSLMIIFPYMRHSIDSSSSDLSETTVIEISIKKAFLEKNDIPFLPNTYSSAYFDSIHLPHCFSFSGKEKRALDSICLDLLEEFNKRGQMRISRMLNLVAQLLTVSVTHSGHAVSGYEIGLIKNRTTCIDNSMSYILDNFAKNITLNDICKFAAMSRSSFTTSFYSTVGQTCNTYITALKMRKAFYLLLQPEKRVSEVAKECGFYDGSHLYRKCIELYGASPLYLRKNASQWLREYGDALYKKSIRKSSWAIPFTEEALENHRRKMSIY